MSFLLQLTITESVKIEFCEDCFETITKVLQQRFNLPHRKLTFGEHLKVFISYKTTSGSMGTVELLRNDPSKKLKALLEKIGAGKIDAAVAYWNAQSGPVYEYGAGVKTLANKKRIADSITVSSYGEASVTDAVDDCWGILDDKSKKAPVKRGFYEIVADRDSLIDIDDNNSIYVARKELFINYTMMSYSKVNDRVLLKFDISFPVQPSSPPNPSDYLSLMQVVEPPEWLSTLRTFIKTLRTEKGTLWDFCVDSSLKELNEWSQVIPMLCGYNERIRRVIPETIGKQVCLFLGELYMAEVPQNYGVPLPGQLGTGNLDIKIGPAVLYSAREVDSLQPELDEGQDEPVDVLNLPVNLEIKSPKSVDVALAQLSSECNDCSLISAAEQLVILNSTGESADTQRIYTGLKAMPSSLLGKRDRAEERVYSDVAGVLTTGHKWQFFNYHTDSLDVTARPRITYRGELSLPVLAYALPSAQSAAVPSASSAAGPSASSAAGPSASSAAAAGPSASSAADPSASSAPDPSSTTSTASNPQIGLHSGPRGSGAEAPNRVNRDNVEMVMAALVLASRTGLKLDTV